MVSSLRGRMPFSMILVSSFIAVLTFPFRMLSVNFFDIPFRVSFCLVLITIVLCSLMSSPFLQSLKRRSSASL